MIDWQSAMVNAEYRMERHLEEVRRNGQVSGEHGQSETEEERPQVLGVLIAAFASLLAAGLISPR